MSQLAPLLSLLKESGAERVFFAPNEEGTALDGESKRVLPGGPVPAASILAALSEILSHDDIDGLSTTRPRIIRHEHDGEEFVLEIVRQGGGVGLGIRFAARPLPRPGGPSTSGPKSARRNSSRKLAAVRPTVDERMTPLRPPSIELDLSSGRGGPGVPAPSDGARAGDAGGLTANDVVQIAREVVREALRAAPPPPPPPPPALDPQEIARVARDVAGRIATEIAERVSREVGHEAVAAAERASKDIAGALIREALGGGAAPGVAEAMQRTPAVAARSGPAKIDGLLRDMLQRKASDLHLSAGSAPVLRSDGEIHFGSPDRAMPSAEIESMLQEIMPERAKNDFRNLNDADFAYEIPGLARFRVNVFSDRHGTGTVIRQIPIEILTAEKLGLPKACLDLCWLSKGLVLVTGPTGSGKSTTLAAMIDFINKNRSDHIITIEDPVEFVHKNQKCLVNQREVGQHTKSFKNALRAALREDPDIVLVGEMRDLETIAIAIETAETGHLVFGTLHTTTAISTVDRIIDQFPADRQSQIRVMLSESLKGVVAQILLPKIGGGRIAAHEILLGNHAVASMVREGKTFQLSSVMQTSKNQGMVTMNDSLMALVQKKLVEPQQAYLKAIDKSGLASMFKNAGIPLPV